MGQHRRSAWQESTHTRRRAVSRPAGRRPGIAHHPARQAGGGARHGGLCGGSRRGRRLADAQATRDSRAERDRRDHQPDPRASRTPRPRGVPRRLSRWRLEHGRGQSGARHDCCVAGSGPAPGRAQGPRAPAGAWRQPGRIGPEPDRAGSAGAPACRTATGGAPPGGPQHAGDRPRSLCALRRGGGGERVHRRHGGGLRLGRSRDLSFRRADRLRAGRGRRARRPGAVPGCGGRPPDPERRLPGGGRCRRAGAGVPARSRPPRARAGGPARRPGRRLDMARRARGAARTEALSTIERVLLDVGGLAMEEAR